MTDRGELIELERRVRRLEDIEAVRELVVRMGTLADARDWSALEQLFTDPVRADWSALSGVPAADVHPSELVDGWRQGLSGLEATHHLIANQQVEVDGDSAHARAYVHAAHRLANAQGDPLWVVAGHYEHRLVRLDAGWRIAAATFRPTWGWGNQQVMVLAAGRA
jgi:hypothetical protein